MKKFRIILGAEVRDKVTGFQGVVMGRCEYATGCDQYLVQPVSLKMDQPVAEIKASHWMDDARLEIVKNGNHLSVETLQAEMPGCDVQQAPKK